jgi:tRNA 2-thiouridine synthesizing protein A
VHTVDARGLACPLPLAMAKRSMPELGPGESLLVLATDPEAPIDLAAWAVDEGHAFRELRPGEFELMKGRSALV